MRVLLAALFVYVAMGIAAFEVWQLGLLELLPGALIAPLFTWLWWRKLLLAGRWFGERSIGDDVQREIERLHARREAGESPDLERGLDLEVAFVRTRRHAAHAHAALVRAGGAMRPWIRWCIAVMGLAWLAGAAHGFWHAWHGTRGLDVPVRLASLWLVIGSGALWISLGGPWRARARFAGAWGGEQRVRLRLVDRGLLLQRDGADASAHHERTWSEVDTLFESRRGIGVAFDDGALVWIPARAFDGRATRSAFRRALCERSALAAVVAWHSHDEDDEPAELELEHAAVPSARA